MSPRTTSGSLPDKPDDWPPQFEEQLNAADLDGVMKLTRLPPGRKTDCS